MGIHVEHDRAGIRVKSECYSWEWSAADDRIQLRDGRRRTVAAGQLQPAVLVTAAGGEARCVAGRQVAHEVADGRVTILYEGVNDAARTTITWQFDDDVIWLDPIVYETEADEAIVGIHYFAEATAAGPRPTLFSSHHVVPGIDMCAAISPILVAEARVHETFSLGAAGSNSPAWGQQWGLPVHYFCGFHRNARPGAVNGLTDALSDAFCCGLASLPVGELWLDVDSGRVSPRINIRGDLWGHRRGPGRLALGPRWLVTLGDTYRDAIAKYYRALMGAGIVRTPAAGGSARKTAIALTPQFNTWGAQVARGLTPEQFDEQILTTIYDEFRASGMRAGMFVIDDKWEGVYGGLEHDAERFPHFDGVLARIRADGYLVGLWAAFLRCQDPAALRLTQEHMLRRPDGTSFRLGHQRSPYSIFDVTQPEVAAVLAQVAKRFVRRYRPDLVKFDFGYELPVLGIAAPRDLEWSGERLLKKGLDVIIGAMKEESPDLAIMYYGLSPLLADHYDLHSPDDLYLCIGDYDLEANRRFFFSSLCGEFGMPTYGSTGYDWVTSPSIWFDAAASGTVGSLNSFIGDEIGGGPKPEWIAKYNGVSQAVRRTTMFRIEPLDANYTSVARGATSSSWARIEDGEVVLVALRAHRLDRGAGGGSYGDVVSSDTTVIVASRDDCGLAAASELAVVPFGTGEVTIRRGETTTSADVTEHYLRGGSERQRIEIEGGILRLPLRERASDDRHVEWIQVSMRDD